MLQNPLVHSLENSKHVVVVVVSCLYRICMSDKFLLFILLHKIFIVHMTFCTLPVTWEIPWPAYQKNTMVKPSKEEKLRLCSLKQEVMSSKWQHLVINLDKHELIDCKVSVLCNWSSCTMQTIQSKYVHHYQRKSQFLKM